MKTYEYCFTVTGSWNTIVEANSEEEAYELANQRWPVKAELYALEVIDIELEPDEDEEEW